MRYARHFLVAILLNILVLPLSAVAAPLSDLVDINTGNPIPGASISAGDKQFSNFTASLGFFGAASPTSVAHIDVSGITVGDRHGLGVRGQFDADAIDPFHGAEVFLLLLFDVTAEDPNVHVTLASVTAVGAVVVGSGFVTVGGGASPSANSIHVQTNIDIISDWPGFAVSDGFDVLFTQSAQTVPEPSIVMLLVGSAGMIAAIAYKIRQV
jgi:hypothetical protein